MSPAEICRVNGWGVGTRLIGDEGHGPTVIEITAIGRESIMALCVSHNGIVSPQCGYEGAWVLYCRDWRLVHSEEHTK